MGDALVRECGRDDPVVLVCTDDGLIIEAVKQCHIDRITQDKLLQNEDYNVCCDSQSGVKSDTFAKVCALL